jgi:hypothetical protein
MVRSLRQLINFYEQNKRAAGLQKDLNLDHNQYNNFQKLQYFDLAKRTKDGWFPTEDGIKFIYGEIAVPTTAATIGKRIIGHNDPIWKTHTVPVEWKFVKNVDLVSYKKRPEFQEEKSNQIKMF